MWNDLLWVHPVVIYLKVGNGLVLMVILPYRDIFMHSHTALFYTLFTCQAFTLWWLHWGKFWFQRHTYLWREQSAHSNGRLWNSHKSMYWFVVLEINLSFFSCSSIQIFHSKFHVTERDSLSVPHVQYWFMSMYTKWTFSYFEKSKTVCISRLGVDGFSLTPHFTVPVNVIN